MWLSASRVKEHWNLLKVVQFIAIANNNCLYVSEIEILLRQVCGKTLHTLAVAGFNNGNGLNDQVYLW